VQNAKNGLLAVKQPSAASLGAKPMPIPVKPANTMCPAEQSEALNESVPANLRQSFDERLSPLQGQSAATRLQSTIRGPANLGGKVKAGSGY
jgi:hypothetical protein